MIQNAVPVIGGLVGPSLIGNVAGAVSGPVQGAAGNAAQLGAGVIGYTADGKPVYGGAALPPWHGSVWTDFSLWQPAGRPWTRWHGPATRHPEDCTDSA